MKYGIKYLLRTIKSSKWYSFMDFVEPSTFYYDYFSVQCDGTAFFYVDEKMWEHIIIIVGI